jgi:hypothetical protein
MLRSTLDKFLDKKVDFPGRNVGHDYNVSNVLFACQLPSPDKSVVDRPFQYDRGAQIIETTGNTDPGQFVT